MVNECDVQSVSCLNMYMYYILELRLVVQVTEPRITDVWVDVLQTHQKESESSTRGGSFLLP